MIVALQYDLNWTKAMQKYNIINAFLIYTRNKRSEYFVSRVHVVQLCFPFYFHLLASHFQTTFQTNFYLVNKHYSAIPKNV